MSLSTQQQAIIDWIDYDNGHLIINARAGCGKTYTLIKACLRIYGTRPRDEIFIGAFNKKIAGEIQEKLKEADLPWKTAQGSTLHSAGFKAWVKVHPNVKVDENKVFNIIKETVKKLEDLKDRKPVQEEALGVLQDFPELVARLVSLGKQQVLEPGDQEAWMATFSHFGMESDLPEEVSPEFICRMAQGVYGRSRELDKEVIDFDDMLLAPLVHGTRFWQKDWVFIDEAQDTNPARRLLALKLLKPNGRLIAVGDPAQAIYGFTGADSNSLDIIRKELNAKELPLSQTFRCPKAVVRFANQWVSDLEALDEAPGGAVISSPIEYIWAENKVDEFFHWTDFQASDVILCRLNAPLVSMAFNLIRKKVPVRVEGRDIGKGLVALATRWKLTTISQLRSRLKKYLEAEKKKAEQNQKMAQFGALEDKVETLLVIMEELSQDGKNQISDVVQVIDELFKVDHNGCSNVLTLCSGHKSKGLEWDRVFWLDRAGTMPSPFAQLDWELEQEDNLAYVIATRAKDTLVELY